MGEITITEKELKENYTLELLYEEHKRITHLIRFNASKLEETNQIKRELEEQLVEDGEKAKQLFNSINFLKSNYVK